MHDQSPLPEPLSLDELQPFDPRAKYNHHMDALVYRRESGLCVAERVDAFLTVLWTRDQSRVVGVRFKGFRWIFNQVREQLNWGDAPFLPLVTILELVVEGGLGDRVIDKQQAKGKAKRERRQKYELARECVEDIHLTKAQIRELVEVG